MEQKQYNINLTAEQLNVIGHLLGQAPYNIAKPIVDSVNEQVKKVDALEVFNEQKELMED